MVGDLTSARRVETMPGVDDGTTVMEEYYRYHDNPYRYHDNLENLLIHALPRIQDDDHSAVRVANITLTNVNYADSQTPTTRATERVRLGWTAQCNRQLIFPKEYFFYSQSSIFSLSERSCSGVVFPVAKTSL